MMSRDGEVVQTVSISHTDKKIEKRESKGENTLNAYGAGTPYEWNGRNDVLCVSIEIATSLRFLLQYEAGLPTDPLITSFLITRMQHNAMHIPYTPRQPA